MAAVLAPGSGDIPRVDLQNFTALESLIAQVRPDVIINAAAYTAVDKAETERVAATKINAEAPGVMALAAKKISAPIVHYSTDYVFAGEGLKFHSEGDRPGPINHYGLSKLAGEEAVTAANPHHLIFRTSWVYSVHGKNFAKTILRLAAERESIDVVSDQFGAPTGSPLIANATAHAACSAMARKDQWGIYHLVASGMTNWFEYASFLVELAVKKKLLTTAPKLRPILSKDFKQAAQRPRNSRLDNNKFVEVFKFPLPEWEVGVEDFVNRLATARA